MWVVKIGGSLGRDPLLRQWLEALVAFGSGRVVIVAGGGVFADEVRDAQSLWHFDDLAAHNMAVLAMAQMALLLQGVCPLLQLAANESELRRSVQQARVPVWLPFEALREQPDELTRWSVTSDSLAAWLANRLHAEHLLLVKSCPLAPGADITQCIDAGILDEDFASFTAHASYPVTLLSRTDLPRLQRLLLAPPTLA
ncbi:MAG: aspartate kinase [Burkholderiaceae bacterium]|nr:aspartate kinase [Burkholderiaceae bacterium]